MGRKTGFFAKIMAVVLLCGVVAVSANSGDKLIDDYEKFMNKYVEVIKKMQAGDMSVIMQMTEFQADLTQWAERVQTEMPKLTPQQAARLKALGEKYEKELGGQ